MLMISRVLAWTARLVSVSCLAAAAAGTLDAQASREEVLVRLFPEADFEAEQVFLTEAQQIAAARIANVEVPSRLIARYVVRRGDEVVGRAYIDTHVVRTKNESLLICLEPDGQVLRVEVTAFLEPLEYMGSELWYGQYEGRRLDDDLQINRAIRPIVGATLTGRATAEAVRRILAIDAVLSDLPRVVP